MYKAWIKGSGTGYPWCLKEGGAYVRTESTDHWRTSEKRKRITGQRKILLDVILEGNWSSCKEIYYMASKKDPTIGLATVYRMVGVLEEMGFLSRGYRYSYPVENKIS